MSSHLRIWPDKTYFWSVVVCWPAIIWSPGLKHWWGKYKDYLSVHLLKCLILFVFFLLWSRVKIYSITVNNTIGGGADHCRECPVSSGNGYVCSCIHIWKSCYWIVAGVIVYIFPHEHMILCIEGIVIDMGWLQTFKELVELGNWWKFWLFVCNIWGEIGF